VFSQICVDFFRNLWKMNTTIIFKYLLAELSLYYKYSTKNWLKMVAKKLFLP
jgi:hypothetical protein